MKRRIFAYEQQYARSNFMDRSGYRPCSLLDAPQQAEAEPLAAPGEVWEEFREFTGLIVPEGIPKGGDDGAPRRDASLFFVTAPSA